MLQVDGQAGTQDPGMIPFEQEPHLPALFEVHQTLYGGVGDDFHITAMPSELEIRSVVERCYEQDAVYENPLLSFSSRPAITDAFLLSRYVSSLCVPGLGLSLTLSPTRWLKGAAQLLRSSIGWRKFSNDGDRGVENSSGGGRWRVASVWSECGDVAESESWDGFIVGVLDHTLHIQIAPSFTLLHGQPRPRMASSPSSGQPLSRPASPPSSLFHIQLRMLSVFQFNEAGRIVFQRDHWDIRDLIESVVPGAGIAGAVGRWAGGLGLRLVGRVVGGCGPDQGRKRASIPRSGGTSTPAETAMLDKDHAGVDSDGPAAGPTASTGGTTSPLSPTLQLRQFRGVCNRPASTLHNQPAAAGLTSSNPSTLTSPTGAAALLAATATSSPPRSTRQRRGTTSSRSWGSAGARSSSVSIPGFAAQVQAATSDLASRSLPSSENLSGILGLDFNPSAVNVDDGGRALDHAP